MTRAAAVYVRISDDREGKALGVQRQEADCRALAERLALPGVEVYADNDVSAFSGKVRPQYRRMLDDVRAGRVAAVLAYAPDRLYRRLADLAEFIDVVTAAGCAVQTVAAGEVDLSTAAGRTTAKLLGVIAEGESDRQGERIRRKLAERAAAGKPHGGQRPFGWEPDRMTIRESEATHLRWAVDAVLGGLPIRAVIRELDARGVTNTRGGRWTHSTLRGVLTKPRHAGIMADGVSPSSWPAIITPEKHRALLRLVNDPARVMTPGRAGKLHLLSGQPCGVCGGPMRVGRSGSRSQKSYYSYRCPTNHCATRDKVRVEEFVLEVIAQRLRRDDVTALLAADADENARAAREAAEASADALRLRLNEAADLFAAFSITGAQLATISAELREQLAAAQSAATPPADRAAALGEVLQAPDRGDAFLAASVDRQRAILDLLAVVRIGRGLRGNVFRPDGIEIEWR